MSRASAYVRTFDGEHVAYGIYDGTSDVLSPSLHGTADAPWDYYYGRAQRPDGRNAWDVVKDCDHELEPGYAYTDYGPPGFHWPARFCRICMVVHGPLNWDGMYDLGPARGTWPKDGEPPIEGTVTASQLSDSRRTVIEATTGREIGQVEFDTRPILDAGASRGQAATAFDHNQPTRRTDHDPLKQRDRV